MGLASYTIVRSGDGWVAEHDGQRMQIEYATKEAAFEAIVTAATISMRDGHDIQIMVPGRGDENDRPPL